jgi:hypothetical protein
MMTDRVYEKEKKIRELLRMGGLRAGTETAGWWVTVLLISSGPIIGLTYILKVSFFILFYYCFYLFMDPLYKIV